jgi:hypothetical protein
LLARERGARNKQDLPQLTEACILRWARQHHLRTGAWPTAESGPVAEAPGEVWANVNKALRSGSRGLPGGDTLSKLLHRHGCRRRR